MSGAAAVSKARVRRRRRAQLHDAALLEVREDLARARVDALAAGVDLELGRERRLVRGGDAGELLDLAGARLLVEAFHVALLADLDRALDVHLDEISGHEGAHLIAVGAVRRDEGGERDDAGVGEELRDLADAADVL